MAAIKLGRVFFTVYVTSGFPVNSARLFECKLKQVRKLKQSRATPLRSVHAVKGREEKKDLTETRTDSLSVALQTCCIDMSDEDGGGTYSAAVRKVKLFP
jgi:hypothetical protein